MLAESLLVVTLKLYLDPSYTHPPTLTALLLLGPIKRVKWLTFIAKSTYSSEYLLYYYCVREANDDDEEEGIDQYKEKKKESSSGIS